MQLDESWSTAQQMSLVAAARAIIAARHRPRWHEIGAALRTTDGALFAAVHLEANIGRAAVCAEAIALGMAIAAGSGPVEAIVAVDSSGDIVAPCGLCREMISDYAPAAHVLLMNKWDYFHVSGWRIRSGHYPGESVRGCRSLR